ncbi:MAG: hypothetical protein LC799_07260, partial [Actinobacteria bacterium]|nr:hypothetical protein [Actinomycetota bacterium]
AYVGSVGVGRIAVRVCKSVKTDRTEKQAADIGEATDHLGIRAQDPFTILAIKALDEELAPKPCS